MADQHASLSRVEDSAARAAAEARPWIEPLGRSGYAARGIVYCVVGVLAAQAAFGFGGETTGSTGALQRIVTQPFGQVLLGIVAVGLVGFALWRLVEAVADPDGKGRDAKGIAARAGYAISGLVYAGLAVTAVRILMGAGGVEDDAARDWTARLMAQPFGVWLVGIVGLIVIGVGMQQLYKGYTAKFREELKTGEMSPAEQTWATRAGRLGLCARGVVFGLIGVFLIEAALRANPNEAQGLAGALAALGAQPFGPWLLGLVAVGLVAYGVFQFVLARYRRMGV